MRVIVTNDDGIDAAGIKALVAAMSMHAKVCVFAPSRQMSASSQRISLRDKILCRKVKMQDADMAYAIDGTPADCVKFGIQELEAKGLKVDYIFSGINMGSNGGADTHYSGTVGAAFEGAMNGYHSIAMSVDSHQAEHFKYICKMIPDLMELSSQLDPSVVLNVNAPNEPEWKVKGTRLTSTGDRTFIDHLMHEDDDRESLAAPNSNGANGANGTSDDDKPKKKAVSIKEGYYSYHGVAQDFTGLTDEADLVALHDGYATITPLLTDITDIKSLRRMKYPKIDTTLVLFIDFQNDIIDKMRKPDQLRNNAVKFAKCMEHLGAFPIMAHRRTSENGLAFKPLRKALGKFERIDRLDMDCFGNAGFEEVIDEKDPARVVIAGVEAHLSVLQTALSFRERGYEVIVIKDCCASAKKEDLETAMDLLAANGCTVTTYEAFAYYMLGRSGKTTYGAIERIVSDPE